jgi:signal peptide peptidase SppA
MKRYTRIVRAFYADHWAILEPKFDAMVEFFELKAAGLSRSEAELADIVARVGDQRGANTSAKAGSVAVVPVFGVIAQRMDMATAISGGTSTEQLTSTLRSLVADASVSAIVLDVDSPGGSVSGLTELAAELRDMRDQKPIVAVVNGLMASAAYWLGASAGEIVVTPSGTLGSIGVLSAHVDESKKNEQEGRKVTIFRSGPNKAADNPAEPLTEEAAAERQKMVDHFAGLFRSDVAKGRGVPVATVRDSFGEGKMFSAKEAVALGMADRVATLDDVIAELASGRTPQTSARADVDAAHDAAMPTAEVADAEAATAAVAMTDDDRVEDARRRARLRLLTLTQ